MTVYIDSSGHRAVAPSDLDGRLRAWLRRRARTEQDRAQLAAARAYAKQAGNNAKLRRSRAGDTNRKESSS